MLLIQSSISRGEFHGSLILFKLGDLNPQCDDQVDCDDKRVGDIKRNYSAAFPDL